MTDIKKINEDLEYARYHCTSSKGKDAINDALDLINRQQAEIEKYKETYGCYPVWNVPCENVFVLSMSCDDYEDFKNQLKAEAIKEFAERLKLKVDIDLCEAIECSDYLYNLPKLIDNIVKEMVGK